MRAAGFTIVALALLASCSLLNPVDAGEFTKPAADAGEGGPAVSRDGGDTPEGAPPDGSASDASPASRYRTAVLADTPIVYLRFGEKTGLSAEAEIGGLGGVYTPAGVRLGVAGALAGDDNTAIELTDGSGQVTIPGGPSFDGRVPFSLEVWFNPASDNSTLGFLLDHAEYADRKGWSLRVGSSGTAFERWVSGASNSIFAPTIAPGAWHHLVATYDGGTSRLYLDGVRVDDGPSVNVLPARGSTLTIGHQSCDCGGGTAFQGLVDEVAIYDRVLTDTQVEAHFSAAR